MQTLLYDLTATQPTPDSKFHGGGTYAEVIFFQLLKDFNKTSVNLLAAYDSSRYINDKLLLETKQKNVPLIDIAKSDPATIFKDYKIDRFYSALLDDRINWALKDTQVITTVHGLRGLEMPFDKIMYYYERSFLKHLKIFLKLNFLKNYFIKKTYSAYSRFFNGNMTIITVSQHSKASILSFFSNIKASDIKVFASPTFDNLDQNPNNDFNNSNKYSLSTYNVNAKKYFILTSSARWIKNNMRAVIALDQLFSEQRGFIKGYKVILTGVNDKLIYQRQIKNKDRFILLDYVNREELAFLEQNAYAFIYPSLNEGFGYPPIESMKYNVPVTCSAVSAICEVCGDGVLYFNPYSISEIKNRIIQLFDKDIYNNLLEKSKIQYKKVCDMQRRDLIAISKYLLSL